MDILPDIPKLYTALAEWLCCLVFVLLLKPRHARKVSLAVMAGALLALCVVQSLIGIAPNNAMWLLGMAVALALMYGILLLCCDISPVEAGFYWAAAFICAEFMASLEWQIYCGVVSPLSDAPWLSAVMMLAVYGAVFWFYFHMEGRKLHRFAHLEVSQKEMLSVITISVGAFLISNISYASTNTPFSGRLSAEIFYIRTLVDFAGVAMIYSHQDHLREMKLAQEVDAIQNMLTLQFEQYKQSRESIELINRKYHDLKHQIDVIRMEPDSGRKEEYLKELELGMQQYSAKQKTGNPVLDIILTSKQMYCQEHGITMTVVADGAQLNFMDTMDICSIFGNALDNAIESVSKLEETEKRLIRVAVYGKNGCVMARVENYFESALKKQGGEYMTTKESEAGYHGYGIKSIRYTAEKYGGSVSIVSEENWFYLRVLIPMNKKCVK